MRPMCIVHCTRSHCSIEDDLMFNFDANLKVDDVAGDGKITCLYCIRVNAAKK